MVKLWWIPLIEISHRGRRELKSIVLLYNDRDRSVVLSVKHQLTQKLKENDIVFWMASEHLTAFGDIFEQIEDRISTAAGTVVFLGQFGLGRFQRNTELGAVNTEIWQQGADYGRLLVHLAPGVEVPRSLLPTLLYHALRREELCKLKVKDFKHAPDAACHT